MARPGSGLLSCGSRRGRFGLITSPSSPPPRSEDPQLGAPGPGIPSPWLAGLVAAEKTVSASEFTPCVPTCTVEVAESLRAPPRPDGAEQAWSPAPHPGPLPGRRRPLRLGGSGTALGMQLALSQEALSFSLLFENQGHAAAARWPPTCPVLRGDGPRPVRPWRETLCPPQGPARRWNLHTQARARVLPPHSMPDDSRGW